MGTAAKAEKDAMAQRSICRMELTKYMHLSLGSTLHAAFLVSLTARCSDMQEKKRGTYGHAQRLKLNSVRVERNRANDSKSRQ